MVSDRDLAELASFGISSDCLTALGDPIPHVDLAGIHPLPNQITRRDGLVDHRRIEGDHQFDLRMTLTDRSDELLHITSYPAEPARCLQALAIDPEFHELMLCLAIC